MQRRLNDKVVVVTGATGAIGRSLCRAMAERGCRLGLLSRNRDKLEALAAELCESGVKVSIQAADMRDRQAVRDGVEAVLQDLGPVDVLILNAGVGRMTRAWAPELSEVEEMFEVNYLGGVYAMEALLPSMLRRGCGHVIAVSSLSALRGMAFAAGYSASKAAMATWLESLRPALRQRGVAVSTCYLGFVCTPMSRALPLHSGLLMISPETAARRIIRVMARRQSEAYFPWYDAWAARLLRRLPTRVFDLVMANFGRLVVKGEY